jgi:tetratricopeptide (TPR) repeat protein
MDIASEARQYCVRGIARHARGELDAARADFEKALEVDPRCAEAWNNRGAMRRATGDLAGALADFNRALEIHPRYAEAYNNRGIARHATGDVSGALNDFDKALEIHPRYAEALSNRATSRQALGDPHGALADFDQALSIRPDYAEAYFGRASARLARKDLDGAILDCDQALQLIPPQAAAPVYHLRGGARAGQLRFADAIADYSRAIEIDPGFCMAFISRGNARHHLRDAGALVEYQAAFRINPQAAAAEVIRMLILNFQEDGDLVFENCRKHLRIYPDDIVAFARRGLTLLLQGKETEAERDFEQCLRRSPAWKDHLELLIETARRCHDR